MSANIRVGDLVKATLKSDPEATWTARLTRVTSTNVDSTEFGGAFRHWDFEVLDRPIDEELLEGAINAWRKGFYGYKPVSGVSDDPAYAGGAKAVIEFVRQYDNKESK